MAEKMTEDQWRDFITEGTRTGKLSTVRADGSPHVAPVWFVLDGDELVLTTGENTVKGRNLARDGRVSICVDDERPPYAFVLINGRAELSGELETMRHWATRIGARYMGQEAAEEFGARNAVPGEVLVRVRIGKVVALSGMTD